MCLNELICYFEEEEEENKRRNFLFLECERNISRKSFFCC